MNNNTTQDLSPNLLAFIWKYFASSDDDTIVLRKSLIDILGSHTTALMVSKLLYWHNKYQDMNRFMKISYEDWFDQLRLSPKQVKGCLKKLKELDVIEVAHKRFNGLRQLHMKINFAQLTKLLMQYENPTPPVDSSPVSPCTTEKLSTSRSVQKGLSGRAKRDRPITQNTTQNTKDNNAHLEKEGCATLPTHENTFKEFWEVYPKKKNKKRAFKLWKDKNLRVISKEIIEKVTEQRKKDKKWSKIQYIPYPTTYLENERWKEEIIPRSPLFQPLGNKPMKLEGIVLEYQNYVQDLKARIRLKLASPDTPILEFSEWKARVYDGKPNNLGNGKMVE